MVLTAAHCEVIKDKQLSIGAYERETVVGDGQPRFCEEWVTDPTYDSISFNNDFALCKLDKPVIIDESKVKLVLNEAETVPAVGEDLIVMGLGALAFDGSFPQFVHNVTVPTISNQDCNAPSSYGGKVTDRMLCAGFPEGGKDSCQGDSGGPIVKREYQGNGTFIDVQVGVASWGDGCALPNYPGVYSRVSSRSTWIKNTICNDFNSVASFCNNSPPPPCVHDLAITVFTDRWPNETGITLTNDSTRAELLSRSYYLKSDDGGVLKNEHSVCLEANQCYTFEITDSFGNGLCYNSRCGSYFLTLNGKQVAQGNGQFGSKEREKFCVNSEGSPTSPPVVAPTDISISSGTPTALPNIIPSGHPSESPSESPEGPSGLPSVGPSVDTSTNPSNSPSVSPSAIQSAMPSVEPSIDPSAEPSTLPSHSPSELQSALPTQNPSESPSEGPSELPTFSRWRSNFFSIKEEE